MKTTVKSQLLEDYCKQNNIEIQRLDHYVLLIKINENWLPFYDFCGPSMSTAIKRILDYKHLALKLLKNNGFAVNDHILFDKNYVKPLLDFAKTRYPIVLKPINSDRGKDIIMCINNQHKLINAVERFQTPSGWGLAEKQFDGKDYRAFVVNIDFHNNN